MKNGKRIFQACLVTSAIALLSPWSALSAVTTPTPTQTDDMPLDLVIPPEARKAIDARKSQTLKAHRQKTGKSVESVGPDLSQFTGNSVVDLRERDTKIKDQSVFKARMGFLGLKKVGTCTAFGLIAATENALGGDVNLSERHLWSQYRQLSASAAISALNKGKGVVEEKWWPENYKYGKSGYSTKDRYKVFEYHKIEDEILPMLAALDRGSPLYFALNTPVDMSAKKPYIQSTKGSSSGGHAVAVVGYKLDDTAPGGGYLLIKNSWGLKSSGKPVGENGYQWLNFAYCAKQGNYCTAWSIDRAGKNTATK